MFDYGFAFKYVDGVDEVTPKLCGGWVNNIYSFLFSFSKKSGHDLVHPVHLNMGGLVIIGCIWLHFDSALKGFSVF